MEDARLVWISPETCSDKTVLFPRQSPLCKAISCSVFSQEFGLARFKSNQVKAMKGLEYALSNLQGMYTSCVFQLKQGREQEEKQRKTKQLIFNCCHFWKGGNLNRKWSFLFAPETQDCCHNNLKGLTPATLDSTLNFPAS